MVRRRVRRPPGYERTGKLSAYIHTFQGNWVLRSGGSSICGEGPSLSPWHKSSGKRRDKVLLVRGLHECTGMLWCWKKYIRYLCVYGQGKQGSCPSKSYVREPIFDIFDPTSYIPVWGRSSPQTDFNSDPTRPPPPSPSRLDDESDRRSMMNRRGNWGVRFSHSSVWRCTGDFLKQTRTLCVPRRKNLGKET